MDQSICKQLNISEETGENKQEFAMNTLSCLSLPQGNRLWGREYSRLERYYFILTAGSVFCLTWQTHSRLGKCDQDEIVKKAAQKQQHDNTLW